MDSPTLPDSPTTVGRVILRNTLFITLGSFALKALNFLFSVFVVRQLGDDRFGQFNIVTAWVGLFSIFAEWGISQYTMREMARDRSQTQLLFWNLLAIRLVLALLGIVGITLGAMIVGYSPEIVMGVLFYTFTFVLAAVQIAFETILIAHERFDYVTALQVVGQVAYILLAGAVLWLNLGLVPFIATGLLAMLPPIFIALWLTRRHAWVIGKPQWQPARWPAMLRGGAPFAIISLTLTIAFSIDTVMLSWTVSESQVGWYNVAYGVVRALVSFLGAFSMAMVPSLTRVYATDPALVEQWYYRSVKFICLLTLPSALGCALIAFPLFGFLYEPSTMPAALVIQVIIWDLPLLMFTSFCGNMTTVIGAEDEAVRIYGLNAIANIILNLYAIPRYGIIGAAFVTVITDLVGLLQFHFSLNRRMRLPDIRSMLVRIGIATVIMGVSVFWAIPYVHFGVLIIIGGLVYGVAVLVLQLLDQSEKALLQRLWSDFVKQRV